MAAHVPPSSARLVGVVDFWDPARGFGFLLGARGASYFAHVTHLADPGTPLRLGHLVEFTPSVGPRGPLALRVRGLDPHCPKCENELHDLAPCRACGFRFA